MLKILTFKHIYLDTTIVGAAMLLICFMACFCLCRFFMNISPTAALEFFFTRAHSVGTCPHTRNKETVSSPSARCWGSMAACPWGKLWNASWRTLTNTEMIGKSTVPFLTSDTYELKWYQVFIVRNKKDTLSSSGSKYSLESLSINIWISCLNHLSSHKLTNINISSACQRPLWV